MVALEKPFAQVSNTMMPPSLTRIISMIMCLSPSLFLSHLSLSICIYIIYTHTHSSASLVSCGMSRLMNMSGAMRTSMRLEALLWLRLTSICSSSWQTQRLKLLNSAGVSWRLDEISIFFFVEFGFNILPYWHLFVFMMFPFF